MAIRIPQHMAQKLIDEGLVPPECREIRLLLPTQGVMVLQYEVFVTREHLSKLARAFTLFALMTAEPVEPIE